MLSDDHQDELNRQRLANMPWWDQPPELRTDHPAHRARHSDSEFPSTLETMLTIIGGKNVHVTLMHDGDYTVRIHDLITNKRIGAQADLLETAMRYAINLYLNQTGPSTR